VVLGSPAQAQQSFSSLQSVGAPHSAEAIIDPVLVVEVVVAAVVEPVADVVVTPVPVDALVCEPVAELEAVEVPPAPLVLTVVLHAKENGARTPITKRRKRWSSFIGLDLTPNMRHACLASPVAGLS